MALRFSAGKFSPFGRAILMASFLTAVGSCDSAHLVAPTAALFNDESYCAAMAVSGSGDDEFGQEEAMTICLGIRQIYNDACYDIAAALESMFFTNGQLVRRTAQETFFELVALPECANDIPNCANVPGAWFGGDETMHINIESTLFENTFMAGTLRHEFGHRFNGLLNATQHASLETWAAGTDCNVPHYTDQ